MNSVPGVNFAAAPAGIIPTNTRSAAPQPRQTFIEPSFLGAGLLRSVPHRAQAFLAGRRLGSLANHYHAFNSDRCRRRLLPILDPRSGLIRSPFLRPQFSAPP